MTSQPTNTEVEALIDEISKWSGEFLNVDTSDMEYDGFNAKSVLKSFLSIKNSMKISNDEFRTDAVALVKIGLMKGNITAKTKKKMTKDGISRLDALLSKYNIKTGVAGSKLAKEDISIPRIVNSFPQIAVQLCHSEGLGKNFSAVSIPPLSLPSLKQLLFLLASLISLLFLMFFWNAMFTGLLR